MFWCLLTEPILKYLGTQLVVQSVPAHKQTRPVAALRKLFVCREGFLCNRVRMSYLWETFSPVCKVSHDTFLLQRHKKVSGAEPERQDVMMSPDFGGCSFERLPDLIESPMHSAAPECYLWTTVSAPTEQITKAGLLESEAPHCCHVTC